VLPEGTSPTLAADTMRHRLVLSYEALAEGLTADALIQPGMARIPVPTSRCSTRRRVDCSWHTDMKEILANTPDQLLSSWSGPCCAGSTACLQGDYRTLCAAPASTWPTCASTSTADETCVTSTGTSPRDCRSRMCAVHRGP